MPVSNFSELKTAQKYPKQKPAGSAARMGRGGPHVLMWTDLTIQTKNNPHPLPPPLRRLKHSLLLSLLAVLHDDYDVQIEVRQQDERQVDSEEGAEEEPEKTAFSSLNNAQSCRYVSRKI